MVVLPKYEIVEYERGTDYVIFSARGSDGCNYGLVSVSYKYRSYCLGGRSRFDDNKHLTPCTIAKGFGWRDTLEFTAKNALSYVIALDYAARHVIANSAVGDGAC